MSSLNCRWLVRLCHSGAKQHEVAADFQHQQTQDHSGSPEERLIRVATAKQHEQHKKYEETVQTTGSIGHLAHQNELTTSNTINDFEGVFDDATVGGHQPASTSWTPLNETNYNLSLETKDKLPTFTGSKSEGASSSSDGHQQQQQYARSFMSNNPSTGSKILINGESSSSLALSLLSNNNANSVKANNMLKITEENGYYGNSNNNHFNINIEKTLHFECGELMNHHYNITCKPEPDAFNPCEDVMGYSILRVIVWLVAGAAILGNLSVIVVLISTVKVKCNMSVSKFLQLNLALADLSMGIYLAMLAIVDIATIGTYFNTAIDWQHGWGCKVAGTLSVFASELSIFTLTLITFERYYAITYAIDLSMRLQLGWAAKIMTIGWIFAFSVAIMPVFGEAGVNSYTKTSICLPLETRDTKDRVYLFSLLALNFGAFAIIFACYLKVSIRQ